MATTNKHIKKLQEALIEFTEDREVPLARIVTFLAIANNEGITASEIAADLGMPKSSVSRSVQSLYDARSEGGASTDLIAAYRNIEVDRRSYNLRLTPRGRKLIEKIAAILS